MNKIIIILILALFVPAVSAQEPGVTPDSIFYGLDVFFDNVKAIFIPTTLGKATTRLDILQERMAEMEEMAIKNKTREAKRAELEGQKQIEKFESSVGKIRYKDVPRLNEYIQTNAEKLEILKQRLRDYDAEWADAISEVLETMEISENMILNIPEDFDSGAPFTLASGNRPVTFESLIAQCIKAGQPEEECNKMEDFCKEFKARTAEDCEKMLSSGFFVATISAIPHDPDNPRPPDPHNCSGQITNRNFFTGKWIKNCCKDSDYIYSSKYIEGMSPDTHYFMKGEVEYKIINLKTEEIEQGIKTDSCDGNIVTEWTCDNHLELSSEEYDCPLGCEDGACIKEEVEDMRPILDDGINRRSLCEDSDGDDVNYYYTKGTVEIEFITTIDEEETSEQVIRTDSCEGNTVKEWMCGKHLDENPVLSLEKYECPNGCEDGACLE